VVASRPLQYSPPNFLNNPERHPWYFPPQGPQNATVFGAFPAAQYPYIEQHTSYVNPLGVAIDHGLSAQPQFHPTGPVQYPVPMNAAGPVEAVDVTYEAPWYNEDDLADEDQSKGKRSYCHIIDKLLTGKRKRAKGSGNRRAHLINPDHLPRTGSGGSLLCDLCRQRRRGKKVSPAAPKFIAVR
jgi:hypothetical protein